MTQGEVVYRRGLPGGGFVAICVTPARTMLGQRRVHGRLVVERRDSTRRVGHEPPVIARTTGDSVASVLNDLFPVAESNTALAAECLAVSRRSLRRATQSADG